MAFPLIALSPGVLRVRGQECECADVVPPSGRSCAESSARGECGRRWMQRGNYCAQTCGFCQCVAEEIDECATCDDISPDATYSCAEQKTFGKCEEPWMKPFCRRTCGRCNCDYDEESLAFGAVGVTPNRVRTITSPLKEVLLDDNTESCPTTILEQLSQAPQFTLLLEIAKTVGLQDTFTNSNASVSVFAPVNEAFVDLAKEFGMTLDTFVDRHPDKVTEILQYHVVPFAIKDEAELSDTFSFPTLVEEKRLFGSSAVEIDGIGSSATIIQQGVKICRSLVYTVDEILLPGTTLTEIGPVVESVPEPQEEIPDCNSDSDLLTAITNDPELSVFLQALEDSKGSAKLQNEDRNLTVFAPTNAAFEIALADLGLTYPQLARDKETLKSLVDYHLLRQNLESENMKTGPVTTLGGEELVIAKDKTGIEIAGVGSSANVVEADIDDVCTGAAHKIDTVLLPFDTESEIWAATRSARAGDAAESPTQGDQDEACTPISRVLAQNSNLRILNDVARGAGLIPVLADESLAITLFAPTDAAFFSTFLDPETGTLSPLLTDPEVLESLVTYHTHAEPLTLKALRPGKKLKTELAVEGESLRLSVVKKRLSPLGVVLIGEEGDEAAVVVQNIVACNSVIHLIDSVLLPFVVEESEEIIPETPFSPF